MIGIDTLKGRAIRIGSAVLIAGVLAMPSVAMADTFSYTPINGSLGVPPYGDETAFSFTKILVMDENASVPKMMFLYDIQPGTAVAGTSTTPEVKPGPSQVVVIPVTFLSSETTYTTVQTGDDVTLAAGKKYAKSNAYVDLRSASFNEPGVYRYIITETGTNNGVTNDPVATRTLDVYVGNVDGGNTLEIQGYVLYEGTKTDAPSATAETADGKSTGYTNIYDTYELEFGKEVKGNQGSLDKYFEFTVTIDAAEFTSMVVDISDADATPHASAATTIPNITSKNNVTSLTIPAGETSVTQKFYLHDGQYITIKGIPANATYSVTEAEEGYTKTTGIAVADNDEGVAHTDAASGTITADVKTGFTNTKTVVTPTGIAEGLMTILPGLLLVGVGAVGIGSYVVVRKRREDGAEA